jgi:hypothetical protein
MVELISFEEGQQPEAEFDMTPAFGDMIEHVSRRFSKDGPRSLLIEDQVQVNENTEVITWQLLTQADIELIEGGAILRQQGKQLTISNLSHPEMTLEIVSLDPPPLELDRQIDNLKRLEFRYPADTFADNKGTIEIRLSGD